MILKLLKSTFVISLAFFLLWSFSDSYSSHTIDNIVHVVAIGIDKSQDDNNMKVSFQFVNTPSSSQGSSEGETSTVVTSINTSTLNKAINLMNSYIGKELNFSHCKVIVFSEDFAKKGISTEIFTMINNEELRPSTNIIISTSDANSYLKNSNPNIEKVVTNYYDTFELTSNFTGYSDDITIGKFYNNLFKPSTANTAILGRTFKKSSESQNSSQESENSSSEKKQEASSQNNNSGQSSGGNELQNDSGGATLEISGQRGTQNVGIAVFKKDKYVGQLSEIDSICHLLVTNNVDSFILSIPNKDYPDNLIDLSISPVRNCKISVDTSSDTPFISLSVFCDAKILTIGKSYSYSNPEVLENLSEQAKNFLKKNIENYLNKTSKELDSDIAGFSKHAIINFLTIEDWDNYNWISKYSNSKFNINVNLNVSSSLLFSGDQ